MNTLKTLIAGSLLALASSATFAGNDSLYTEGNFSFLDSQGDAVARTIVPTDPVALETLYQEGNFPAIEQQPTQHQDIVHEAPPARLYQEGNFPV